MIKDQDEPEREEIPTEEVKEIFDKLNKNFTDLKPIMLDVRFRKTQLLSLLRGLEDLELNIYRAGKSDLGLSKLDAYISGLLHLKLEVKEALKNLKAWMAPKERKTSMVLYPGKSYLKPQARGTVLIISSWNYPFSTVSPFISAVTAGNCVVVKPSEHAPASSKVIKDLFDNYLDNRFYRVIEGGVETAKALTQLPFDLVCFTGSSSVGKLVAQEAAKNLAPCILELGGKCPAIVDHTAKLEMTARRLVSGKFMNCGQTCIAPDFIFVHPKVKKKFVSLLKRFIEEFYGPNPKSNSNYSRIINTSHAQRIADFATENRSLVINGDLNKIDIDSKYIPPIILDNPKLDSEVMNQEIFGPVFPIVDYSKPQDMIDFINSLSKPLAIYYFGKPDSILCKRLKNRTTSGAFVINECVLQAISFELPFGGVGGSGYGRIRGREGFEQFSNMKSVLERPNSKFMDLKVRYPAAGGDKRIKKLVGMEANYLRYQEDVFCWVKSIVCLALLAGAFYALDYYGIFRARFEFMPGKK